MKCSRCGASAEVSCNCGVAYVPVRERARKFVEANPEKSDRAIAKEIGVSDRTVNRARKNSTATFVAVDAPRVGRDGKVRRLPSKKRKAKLRIVSSNDTDAINDAINQFSRAYEKLIFDYEKQVLSWIDRSPNVSQELLYGLSNIINTLSSGLVFKIDDKAKERT
jgi:hypothetical protein